MALLSTRSAGASASAAGHGEAYGSIYVRIAARLEDFNQAVSRRLPGQLAANAEQFARKIVLERLEHTGQVVADRARELVPVETGELRSSIVVQLDAAEMAVYVICQAPYAIFVEFGTRLWAGHPFLRPALAAAGSLWGGHYNVSVHAAAVLSQSHPQHLPYQQGTRARATIIAGTLAPHRINQGQVALRKKRNKALARQLKGVQTIYHGAPETPRTEAIRRHHPGALSFRQAKHGLLHRLRHWSSRHEVHWEAD